MIKMSTSIHLIMVMSDYPCDFCSFNCHATLLPIDHHPKQDNFSIFPKKSSDSIDSKNNA